MKTGIQINQYQKAAILNEDKACIVNANVGSGKTTVLTGKIRYLHEKKQIPYEHMVVLTFTNKAANEIRERLENPAPGESGDRNLEAGNVLSQEMKYFGTFHSVALQLLRDTLPIEKLGYEKDFMVIEPEEELEIALQLIGREHLQIKYRNRLRKRMDQEKFNRYGDDLEKLRGLLQEEKKRQNKMSFSDLLVNVVELLKMFPVHFAWIIIDEVQDSDNLQLEFIEALKGTETRLFAVGDPNQVIYSWRGSACNVFYTLREKYHATELSLPVNYRSTTSILEAAKVFLQNGSPLEGVKEPGKLIRVRKQYDSFQEAYYLVERIRALHEEGIPYHEIAIFYRLQNQSASCEQVFAREEIPYEVTVKKGIADEQALDDELQAEACNEYIGEDSVKLMTLHASKGLEFSYVFIIGVNNGLIPLQGKGFQEEDEERRLFFVGITRAKEQLELCYYTNPDTYRTMPGESRFLRMIPERLIETENIAEQKVDLQELKKQILEERKKVSLQENLTRNEISGQKLPQQETPTKVVQTPEELSHQQEIHHQVTHPKYGTGTIVKEDDTMVTIIFEGYGEIEFMKAFTQLEYL